MSIDHVPYPAYLSPASSQSGAPTSITIRPGANSSGQPDAPFFGGQSGNPSFGDLLDIINPLQHIPIVSTIYQKLTGDVPSPAADIIGGTLFGGPIGLMASVANEVVHQVSGKDIGGNILAAVTGNTTPVASGAAPTVAAQTDDNDTQQTHGSFAALPNAPSPAQAAGAYRSAQNTVLSLFDPDALAHQSASAAPQ